MRKTEYQVVGTWKTGNEFTDGPPITDYKQARKDVKRVLDMPAVAKVELHQVTTVITTVGTWRK